ncbi:unnamed protein product, partial [Allacma fusca]
TGGYEGIDAVSLVTKSGVSGVVNCCLLNYGIALHMQFRYHFYCASTRLSAFGQFSPELTGNNSSNIIIIGKDVYTLGDSCFFHRIDPENLENKERHDTNKLFNFNIHTAHPMPDSNGDLWNIGYTVSVFTGLKFYILKIPQRTTVLERFKKSKTVASRNCSQSLEWCHGVRSQLRRHE